MFWIFFEEAECRQFVLEKIEQLKQSKQRQNFRMQLQISNLTIPVMASINFLEFAQKTTLYFTFIDISDLVKLEEELQNRHLMLAQKQKMKKWEECLVMWLTNGSNH